MMPMNNVLQALIYVFRQDGKNPPPPLDHKTLIEQLDQFGMPVPNLEQTLSNMMAVWASKQSTPSALSLVPQNFPSSFQAEPPAVYPVQSHTGTRLFSPYECRKISKRSRGFLMLLRQVGISTVQAHEFIIDQLLHSYSDRPIPLKHTKRVTFHTLFRDAPVEHLAYLEWLLFVPIQHRH